MEATLTRPAQAQVCDLAWSGRLGPRLTVGASGLTLTMQVPVAVGSAETLGGLWGSKFGVAVRLVLAGRLRLIFTSSKCSRRFRQER